jgi:hypothetical protein
MKELYEASVAEEREPSKKSKQDKTKLLLLVKVTIFFIVSCIDYFYIVLVNIMHIYFIEEKVVSETIPMEE